MKSVLPLTDRRRALFSPVCWVTVLGLVCSACAATDSSLDELRADFKSPTKAQRPSVRWWWPGGDVDDGRLAAQLAEFDRAGFGSAEIQPFVIGLPPAMVMGPGAGDRINDYATPAFFRHVAAAAQAAQASGLRLDYTLGSAWPSGGVSEISPALAQRELAISWQTVHGPTHFNGPIQPPTRTHRLGTLVDQMTGGANPDAVIQLQAQERIVAVLGYRGTAPVTRPLVNMFGQSVPNAVVEKSGQLDPQSAVVLTDKLRADGTLDWEVPSGEWQLIVCKSFVSDMRVVSAAGRGTKYVLDHLNRRAFEAFASRVFESGLGTMGPYAGTELRSLFVDSLELEVDGYWSDDLLAEFQRRRGYDLTPFLPAILHPGWEISYHSYVSAPTFELGDASSRVWADFRLTLSELMLENFYGPFAETARAHGMLSRMQVHGAPVDLIRGYGLASIPETESMAVETRPVDVDLHLARSAAHIYGRDMVSAEAMCWKGNPYAPTPETWKRRADYFFVLGVNHLVYHGAPYPYFEDTQPGWHPFSLPFGFSSFFSTDHPYWPHLSTLNSYVARLQAVLQKTSPASSVAIYRSGLSTGPVGQQRPEKAIADALTSGGYLFDLINADGLNRSELRSGKLVTPGGTCYSALILPQASAIRIEMADKLVELAAKGFPIVFTDGEPARYEGWLDHERNDEHVRNSISETKRGKAVRLSDGADVVRTLGQLEIRPNLAFRDAATVPFIEKRAGECRFFFLYNPDNSRRQVTIQVAGHGSVERWNPWNGVNAAMSVTRIADETGVDLTLEAGESALLLFNPKTSPQTQAVTEGTASRVISFGARSWVFRGVGYGKNGRSIDVTTEFSTLPDWTTVESIKDLAGQGIYTTMFNVDPDVVTRGTRVILNLGAVHDLAEVKINGHAMGTILMPPFALDITTALQSGENTLQVTVANSPNNAMVGREVKQAWGGAPATAYSAARAGLLGPVRLEVCAEK